MSFFHVTGSEKKPGKNPLRLLILAGLLVIAFVLGGCGASKYEAVDLSMPGTTVTLEQQMSGEGVSGISDSGALEISETEKPVIVLGKSGSEDVDGTGERTGSSDLMETNTEEEGLAYIETDDYVIVIADTLNVREYDSTNSRIFVQIPRGEVLHRIAYNDVWCCIEYDDGIAYVAADMVELTESPVETTAEIEETSEGQPETDVQATAASEYASANSTKHATEQPLDDSNPDIPVYQKTGITEEEEISVPLNGYVVAIDAGHQAKANAEKEPIGPASQTKKAKMPEGAVGTVTGVKEYELTLLIAKQLETELKARGYEVVMIRKSHDVNLSEAERSVLANESGADIFIRLHANSMESSSIYGAMAMCMTEYNPYNSELSADSYRLSKQIINNICANTGTKNRGVQMVDNSSSVNWCQIPVSVVEMGFLTNPDEDRWLQEEEYQGKIVSGISDAIDTYFHSAAGE